MQEQQPQKSVNIYTFFEISKKRKKHFKLKEKQEYFLKY